MGTILQEKFWGKVALAQHGCWEWVGRKDVCGYGTFSAYEKGTGKRRHWQAHRFAYEDVRGPIPAYHPRGYQFDHICKNEGCVNPEHLQLVMPRENTLRSGCPAANQARQTHCSNGHPLFGDNLKIRKCGRRLCRICKNLRSKEEYKRKKSRGWRPKIRAANTD